MKKSSNTHGKYREWHSNGNLFLEATFKKRKLHGVIKFFNNAGVLIERCRFIKGQAHGHFLTYYPNGTRDFSYEFKHGKLQGWVYHWDKSGKTVSKASVKDTRIYEYQGDRKLRGKLALFLHESMILAFKKYTDIFYPSKRRRFPFSKPAFRQLLQKAVTENVPVSTMF